MQCLHDIHGIVHGDLKALNALYFEAGGTYKLCDFGFSKTVSYLSSSSAMKTVSARTGTPFWRAPEMFGRKVFRDKASAVSARPFAPHVCFFTGGGSLESN